jgi:hypothetical protein
MGPEMDNKHDHEVGPCGYAFILVLENSCTSNSHVQGELCPFSVIYFVVLDRLSHFVLTTTLCNRSSFLSTMPKGPEPTIAESFPT